MQSKPIQIQMLLSESSPIQVEQAGSEPIQSSPEMLCICELERTLEWLLTSYNRAITCKFHCDMCCHAVNCFQEIHSRHHKIFSWIQSNPKSIICVISESNQNPCGLDWIGKRSIGLIQTISYSAPSVHNSNGSALIAASANNYVHVLTQSRRALLNKTKISF